MQRDYSLYVSKLTYRIRRQALIAVGALAGYAPDHPRPERIPSAPAPHQKYSSYKRVSAHTETLAANTIMFM